MAKFFKGGPVLAACRQCTAAGTVLLFLAGWLIFSAGAVLGVRQFVYVMLLAWTSWACSVLVGGLYVLNIRRGKTAKSLAVLNTVIGTMVLACLSLAWTIVLPAVNTLLYAPVGR